MGRRSDLRRPGPAVLKMTAVDGWRHERVVAAVAVLLLLTGCGDTKIYCGVPDGGDVNMLGRQN